MNKKINSLMTMTSALSRAFWVTLLAFFMLFGFIISANAQNIDLTDIRIGEYEGKTRFVLDISQESEYRIFTLKDPVRVVVDLPTARWGAADNIGDPTGIIKDYRHGAFNSDVSRLVLDLNRPVEISNAYMLAPEFGRPYRLVVDLKPVSYPQFHANISKLFGTRETPRVTSGIVVQSQQKEAPLDNSSHVETEPTPEPNGLTVYKSAADEETRESSVYKPLIVLDAGHGGHDPGAIASTGAHEKNITLAAALELRSLLLSTGRYRVRLTRDKDYFLELRQRTSLARKYKGDVFISLHADTISRRNVKGASIYTLSDNASDKEAARLATQENLSGAIRDIDLSIEEGDVADILIDLAIRDSMNRSKVLADTLITTMKSKGITLLQNTHRYAGFAVLKTPDMPAVLIEMGYLSNPNEARRLMNKSYRRHLLSALVAGLDRYFKEGEGNSVF